MRGLVFAVLLLAGLLVGTPVRAESLSFFGNYTLDDFVADGFSERLRFDNPFGSHSGLVMLMDPASDGLFSDPGFETVEFAALTLDPANPFEFQPTLYVGGFRVWDDDGTTLLLQADLEVLSLEVNGSTGKINSAFAMNLTGITSDPGYVPGSSVIVDTFLLQPGGAANVTLQLPGLDLAAAIQSGATITSSYSGSAAHVPEPDSTWLLLPALLGLARFGRRRSAAARPTG